MCTGRIRHWTSMSVIRRTVIMKKKKVGFVENCERNNDLIPLIDLLDGELEEGEVEEEFDENPQQKDGMYRSKRFSHPQQST